MYSGERVGVIGTVDIKASTCKANKADRFVSIIANRPPNICQSLQQTLPHSTLHTLLPPQRHNSAPPFVIMAPTFPINGDLSGHDLAQQIVEIFEKQNLLDKHTSTHATTTPTTSVADGAPSQINMTSPTTASNVTTLDATASNITALNSTASNITTLDSTASNVTVSSQGMLRACGPPGNGTVTTECLFAMHKSLDNSLYILFLMLCGIIVLLLIR